MGNGQPPVAQILVTLTRNGGITCQFSVPDVFTMHGMLGVAQQQILGELAKREAEKGSGIIAAPPGMAVARND